MNDWRLTPRANGSYLVEELQYGVWQNRGVVKDEEEGRKIAANLKRKIIYI